MHIGLIGGIGPASTEFYYRALVRIYQAAGQRLALTITNADFGDMVKNMQSGDAATQACIFAHHVDQLKAAGCEVAAITSFGGHFCIGELQARSSLPLISGIAALDSRLAATGVRRVGVLGTKTVMESKLYGLSSVEVAAPLAEDIPAVHAHYIALASSGEANEEQRRFFELAGRSLYEHGGAEIVVLGGTDLFLAFGGHDYGYPTLDSALVHAEAIARLAMNRTGKD